MKLEFAPLNIPLARRLQTAAVFQWVLSFLLLGKNPARSGLARSRETPRSVGLRLLPPRQSLSKDLLGPSNPPSPVSQNGQVKEGVWSYLGTPLRCLSPREPPSE